MLRIVRGYILTEVMKCNYLNVTLSLSTLMTKRACLQTGRISSVLSRTAPQCYGRPVRMEAVDKQWTAAQALVRPWHC